ncbi:TIGR03560 family F420-dependent LLM class oxidoreductase [Actinospongicola halichondriae]|uniref:TIGR03560 family F420-dependent LLM class oxidoreductase n=1 Tax=Actinospongicola halichondriae TaxID=3236844 RepID=UPI003D464EE9
MSITPMEFAVWPGTNQAWDGIVEVARHAELSGWDRVYVADHFMPNGDPDDDAVVDGPMLECWSVVAALAAAVPRIGIGTLVCGNTYRHPAVLANQAATADVISGGRVILGLGAGWQVNEHQRYGIDMGSLKARMDRFEEACAVVRGLRDEQRFDFAGEYYQLAGAPMEPKPIGSLPLLIGGGGEQRTLRIAARHADEWNVWSDPELFAQKSGVLDERCAEVDRDPATIRRSTQALLFLSDDEAFIAKMRSRDIGMRTMVGNPEQLVEIVAAYRDAGVDELIIPDFTLGTGEQRRETLDRFHVEVAAHFSGSSSGS